MSYDVTIVHCFVNVFTICFCQFKLLEVSLFKKEDILLLIELKYKLLHYKK